MDKTLLFIVNPRAGKTKSSAPRVEIRNLHSAVQLMIQDDE